MEKGEAERLSSTVSAVLRGNNVKVGRGAKAQKLEFVCAKEPRHMMGNSRKKHKQGMKTHKGRMEGFLLYQ